MMLAAFPNWMTSHDGVVLVFLMMIDGSTRTMVVRSMTLFFLHLNFFMMLSFVFYAF